MKYLKKFNQLNESIDFPTDRDIILKKLEDKMVLEDLSQTTSASSYMQQIKAYIEKNATIHSDGTVDFRGDVVMNNIHGKLPVKFGEVTGKFVVAEQYFSTLEGFPHSVGGDFDITNCEITSLEGGPKKVGGYYLCSFNEITSLKGCPESVGESFICTNNPLTSLEYGPKTVGTDYNVESCFLTSLKGAPKVIPGYFGCSYNDLKNLLGGPEHVEDNFSCSSNQNMTSLEGGPKSAWEINCDDCKLETLEGCPQNVNVINCSNNISLKSFKGAPESIEGSFVAMEVGVENFEYLPKSIGGEAVIDSTNLYSPEGLRDVQLGLLIISSTTPLFEIKTLFKSTKDFQDSLDYNYIQKKDDKWVISLFKLREVSEEFGIRIPTQFKFYECID